MSNEAEVKQIIEDVPKYANGHAVFVVGKVIS